MDKERIRAVQEMIEFWQAKSKLLSCRNLHPEILETIQYLMQLKIRLENE